jgi:hypothetical protein
VTKPESLTFGDATTEGEVLKGTLVELSRRGFLVWRNNSGALYETFPAGLLNGRQVYYRGRLVHFGQEGTPDIIGFCRTCGLFTAPETKRPRGGVMREMQEAFAAQAKPSGALVFTARTVAEAVRAADAHRCTCRR